MWNIIKNQLWEASGIAGFYSRNKKDVDTLLSGAAFIAAAYLVVKVLFDYVAPFAVGGLLALAFEPAAASLESRFKMRRGLLAALSVVVLLCVIALLSTIVATRVATEAYALSESLPEQTAKLSRNFENLREKYLTVTEYVPEQLREAADTVGAQLAGAFTSAVGDAVKRMSGSVVKVVPGTLVGVVLCFISMFFFVKDHGRIAEAVASRTPPAVMEKFSAVKRGLLGALAGYIRAQSILVTVSGIICMIGLIVIGYPYSLLIALAVAVFDFLPVFGPGFILWPWSAAAAIGGDYRLAVGLLVIYAVITVVRQVIEPKVLGDQLGMHPLIMLLSMFVGVKVFGVLGFLIGPVIVIMFKAMYSRGGERRA